MNSFELHQGDCLATLRGMADNSVDSIVTDPPYGLSFMGKKWDYDVPSVDVWTECLRVLKPGGHLLAFAGTRTQHRMAVRIEDAGFEIRDMIAWVYGSGFPKSLDVSKAIDKVNGEAGRLHKFTAWMRTTGLTGKQINDATGTFMGSHYLTDKSQPAIPTPDLWALLRPLCCDVPGWVDELVARIAAEREVVGQDTKARSTSGASALPTVGGETVYQTWDITAPATEAARQWQGWGTALKPALEPITVARKPLIGTVAANVLEWGTGGLNIDRCRVATDDDLNGGTYAEATATDGASGSMAGPLQNAIGKPFVQPAGRWPANLIHDGSEEVLAGFPQSNAGKPSDAPRGRRPRGMGEIGERKGDPVPNGPQYGDTGSAARFFYCAKASKRDRDEGLEGFEQRQPEEKTGRKTGSVGLIGDPENRGQTANPFANGGSTASNIHPTVKPTDLMAHLVRLVTPAGGIVLDPFMGSGSTGKAAMREGFRFIGCELSPEYLAIARARIEHELGLVAAASAPAPQSDMFSATQAD